MQAIEIIFIHNTPMHYLFHVLYNKCIIIINNMNSIIHSFYLLQYDIEEVNDRPS